MRRTQFMLPPKLYRALKAAAKDAGVSMAELVRRWLAWAYCRGGRP